VPRRGANRRARPARRPTAARAGRRRRCCGCAPNPPPSAIRLQSAPVRSAAVGPARECGTLFTAGTCHRQVAALSPLVEIGAGAGHWQVLARQPRFTAVKGHAVTTYSSRLIA
jgi:hypothetical protein